MYLVKYEVIATSMKQAMTKRGHLYEISLASKSEWPEDKPKKVGFNKKSK